MVFEDLPIPMVFSRTTLWSSLGAPLWSSDSGLLQDLLYGLLASLLSGSEKVIEKVIVIEDVMVIEKMKMSQKSEKMSEIFDLFDL